MSLGQFIKSPLLVFAVSFCGRFSVFRGDYPRRLSEETIRGDYSRRLFEETIRRRLFEGDYSRRLSEGDYSKETIRGDYSKEAIRRSGAHDIFGVTHTIFFGVAHTIFFGAPGPDPAGPGAPSGPRAGPAPLGHEP